MYQPPVLNKKPSGPWDRLRPVRQDPLESVGFVSKGDTRLLNPKAQESYYHKITARYMQFCTHHSKNLSDAFQSLTLEAPSSSTDERTGPLTISTAKVSTRPATADPASRSETLTKNSKDGLVTQTDSATEISNILTALRKLREAILATSSSAPSPVFSQRVHVFSIRLAILALHPESYHASLRYLLSTLHSRENPLPATEFKEMMSYLILDTALRLGNLNDARLIQVKAKYKLGFLDKNCDTIIRAVISNNWPLFWTMYNKVDGYTRALMHWRLDSLRRHVLKCFGRAYMKCKLEWLLQSSTGSSMSWEGLVDREDVGWVLEGDIVWIRKPKAK